MQFARPCAARIVAGLLCLAFVASATAQPVDSTPSPTDPFAPQANDAAESAGEKKAFTGSLTIRQKGGALYYKVYVVEGRAIGGFDTWRGSSRPYHRVVGGWYDGERMTLLMQSTQNDVEDKWFSHAHHFQRQGDEFVIEQSLYDHGKTIDSGEVYQPHIVDELVELSEEDVRRLAENAEPGQSSAPQEATEDAAKPEDDAAKRLARAERENERLKKLLADLLLENDLLKRRLNAE